MKKVLKSKNLDWPLGHYHSVAVRYFQCLGRELGEGGRGLIVN